MEVGQAIRGKSTDRKSLLKTKTIIFLLCFSSFLLIIYGFILLENSIIEIIVNSDYQFGEGGIIIGVVLIILGPIFLLSGYPIMIRLFKKSMV